MVKMNMEMKMLIMGRPTQLTGGRVGSPRRALTMMISGLVILVPQMGEKIKKLG
jgi:hypothetical protein